MRRMLVVVAVGVSVLAAAAWVGVAVAQKEDPANRLEGWKYPGATQLGAGGGAGANHMVLTTSDELEKVAAFYGKKVGQKLSSDRSDRPGGTVLRGGDGEVSVFQDDSVQAGAKAELRPVVVRIFVQRTKG
jgi:hypothetical protein